MKTYYVGKEKGNYKGVIDCGIADVVKYCRKKRELGVDIETSYKYSKNTFPNEDVYKPGLDPYLSRVVMLQIGDLENNFVIDTRSVDISELIPVLNDENIVFVGHNLKFEAKHLGWNYGVVFKNIWDTMLVEMNLNNGLRLSNSLANVSVRYLGVQKSEDVDLFNARDEDKIYIDKSVRMGFLHIGDKKFSRDQVIYGAEDIIYPLRIKKIQEKRTEFTVVNELENKFCLCLADIELKGMPFNPEMWYNVYLESKNTYQRRLRKINYFVENNYPEFIKSNDLFSGTPVCTINWGSSDQVIEFFKHLKICPKEKSKETGLMEWTVGAKALMKQLSGEYKQMFSDGVEVAAQDIESFILSYLQFKKAEQAITTFGVDWLKNVHPITKRVHSDYRQILNTGRISSNNPNLQNIPNLEEYRSCFVSDKIIVNCDYSSQESRVLADISGDENMLGFFNNGHPVFGDDFHSFVATRMFQIIRNDPDLIITKKTYPKERQDAKAIGFKIAYGGSAFTLKDDFGVEEDIAQEFIDGYFKAFPSLLEDFENAKKLAVKQGWIEIDSVTKRRWYDVDFNRMRELKAKLDSMYPKDFKKWSDEKKEKFKEELKKTHPNLGKQWSEYFSWKGKLERNALNYRIQGLSGSMTKIAAILFRKYQLEKKNFKDFYIINLVHDEILVECNPEYSEEISDKLKECMEKAGEMMCKRVKMGAKPVVANCWGH